MDYDPSKIKTVERIVNGKKVKIKVIPEGMHGEGWKPELFDDTETNNEEDVKKTIKKELSIEEADEPDTVDKYERTNE